jgi:ATP-binding cassette subfamily F protein 3
LRLVVRELKPQKGTINVCQKVAYLPQVPKIEGLSLNVIDYFRQYVAVGEEEAREFLGRVLFQDISGKKLGDLSMGEIRRIQLAMLFAQRPNLIILDEPTNHLDIFTIEMLEEALKKFKGGMLVVSHDEMFLRNIRPERFLIFLGRGKIQEEKEFPNLEEIFAKTAQAGKQS